MLRKLISLPHLIIFALLAFAGSCSRIDHKQSALDPKGLVAQNQYDVFMLSVWITIFLFCAVGGCLLYVLWRYRAKTPEEAKEIPPQSHGNSMIETGLIVVSAIILVVLAVPTLQGIVLLLTGYLMPMMQSHWKSLVWIVLKLMVPLLSM